MSFIQPPFWATRQSWRQPLHTTAVVVTPPAAEPVSLVQVKQRLRITHNEEDADIADLITTARLQVEKDLNGACLGETVVDQWFDRVPNGRSLPLLRWPVIEVDSVKTYAIDDVETVFSAGDYLTDFVSVPSRVLLNDDASWPTGLRTYRGVVVRYTCGFPNGIPETYKLAMMMLVAHWFLRRAPVVDQSVTMLPLGYSDLLSDAPVTVP